MKKEKNVMTPKRQEIIKNLSITISKESKKVNGRNIKLIETLQKILDKAKRYAYLLLLIKQHRIITILNGLYNKRLASICSNEKWRRNKKACRSYDNF